MTTATASREAMLRQANGLQKQIARYKPGTPVEVFLGVDRDLSELELWQLQQDLVQGGLDLLSPASMGATDWWANTLRLEFRAPYGQGPASIGMLPLAVLIILAAGAVGIAGILGWKVGSVVESLGKYIVPLALIGAATLVFMKVAERKKA